MKTAPINLVVNFCNQLSLGARVACARTKGTQLYAQGFHHIREALRDFVLFGAGVRIEELTLEREQLVGQLSLLEDANHELHGLLDESQANEAGLKRSNDYLLKEKTRLVALNADLTNRLNNLTPEQRCAVQAEKEALQAMAQAEIEKNRRLDLLAKRAWNHAGQKPTPPNLPPRYCLN